MEDLPEEEQDTSGGFPLQQGLLRLCSRSSRGSRELLPSHHEAPWMARRCRLVSMPPLRPPLLLPPLLCRHEQVRRGPAEPGQHVLHEQHGAVPVCRARAAAEVRARCSTRAGAAWMPSGGNAALVAWLLLVCSPQPVVSLLPPPPARAAWSTMRALGPLGWAAMATTASRWPLATCSRA